MNRLLPVLALVALAGCGKVGKLEPAAGSSLPVKPLLATVTPDADALLTPPPYAAPARVDELMKKSQPRQADRFDLPPPSGGKSPAPPETPAGKDTPPTPASPEGQEPR